jgi:hypothetical protein
MKLLSQVRVRGSWLDGVFDWGFTGNKTFVSPRIVSSSTCKSSRVRDGLRVLTLLMCLCPFTIPF